MNNEAKKYAEGFRDGELSAMKKDAIAFAICLVIAAVIAIIIRVH